MNSRRQNEDTSSKAVLALSGPALLKVDGRAVRLRTKGLALLCYLAVEGPTRRERLADVLWGHGQALQNLRVELHRLKKTLHKYDLDPFATASDPIELSGEISLSEGEGTVLEGLEDVSPAFQEWLDQRRARVPAAQHSNYHEQLATELAGRITAPFVVVAAGLPGSGRRALARHLAAKLGLSVIEGECGSGPAVRYIVPSEVSGAELAACIVADGSSVWVVEQSLFGEDPELILQLRSRMPASRMRFVKLPALDWWNVKSRLPEGVKFTEGARLFLASGGNSQYLDELLDLRSQGGLQDQLPVPLRMRAAIALEARSLGSGARRALESASVHRGVFSIEALEILGAAEHLEELERNGWLTFVNGGWGFSSELVRRLLESQLQEGLRRRSHQALAAQLAHEGAYVAAEYHRVRGAGFSSRQPELSALAPKNEFEKPRTATVVVGPELWLDEAETEGSSVLVDGDKVVWSRSAASDDRSEARFALEEQTLLLRVRGRAHVQDSMSRDFTEQAAALTISLPGSSAVLTHLCDVTEPAMADGASLRLPIDKSFEYWLLTPAAGSLLLSSRAHGAVIEMKVNAFRPKAPPTTDTAGHGVVEAFVLERSDDALDRESWFRPDLPQPHSPELAVR